MVADLICGAQQPTYIPSYFVCRTCTYVVNKSSLFEGSVSTPRTPPVAFQSSAQWRLLIPRNSKQINKGSSFCSSEFSDSRRCSASALSASESSSGDSIIDKIARALGIDLSFKQDNPLKSLETEPKRNQGDGQVVRTAARSYQPSGGSLPSSREYTTRKSSLPLISVSSAGVTGDYNHYRTTALKSTGNRAISILTKDVSSYIESLDHGFFAKPGKGYTDGDLGENILVKGVDFNYFRIGQRYRFSVGSQRENNNSGDTTATTMEDVIIEITEPMEPCANLCKLPYINDPGLPSPKERIKRCQYFIAALGQKEGLRGWYAMVVQGGVIRIGDSLSAVGSMT